jgi:hypothetical protein
MGSTSRSLLHGPGPKKNEKEKVSSRKLFGIEEDSPGKSSELLERERAAVQKDVKAESATEPPPAKKGYDPRKLPPMLKDYIDLYVEERVKASLQEFVTGKPLNVDGEEVSGSDDKGPSNVDGEEVSGSDDKGPSNVDGEEVSGSDDKGSSNVDGEEVSAVSGEKPPDFDPARGPLRDRQF